MRKSSTRRPPAPTASRKRLRPNSSSMRKTASWNPRDASIATWECHWPNSRNILRLVKLGLTGAKDAARVCRIRIFMRTSPLVKSYRSQKKKTKTLAVPPSREPATNLLLSSSPKTASPGKCTSKLLLKGRYRQHQSSTTNPFPKLPRRKKQSNRNRPLKSQTRWSRSMMKKEMLVQSQRRFQSQRRSIIWPRSQLI